jgi:hypothetical protein
VTTIDRGFARGILFGAAVAGLALSPIAATAMPLDDRVPTALSGWIENTQAVVVRPVPRRRLGARCGVAGGIGAVASAAGAGDNLTIVICN